MRNTPFQDVFREIETPAACRESAAICSAAAAAAYRIALADIASPRRGRARVALARHLAIYLQHVAFGATLSACGRLFARDRASVRHACARIEDARDDPGFDRAVAGLEAALLRQRGLLSELTLSFQPESIGDK